MFKILSWNVRGLNEEAKRLRVRNLLSLWKVDIVCLQETKFLGLRLVLCIVCGDALMLIGVLWLRKGLRGAFC
jgi:hypothetical protein